MSNAQYLLAVDQGTSSSRAVVYNRSLQIVGKAQQEFPQLFPRSGWVEHDPEAIWQSVQGVLCNALKNAKVSAANVAAIGITNQRETTLLWDRSTGECVYNAIVWQDRRTADYCRELIDQGHEEGVVAKTGLRLDPYFSATKIAWILQNVEGVRERAESGRLAFGTIDCFLLWRLTNGRVHATDASNASRTLLYNIHTQQWDEELVQLFEVPAALLPEVCDCACDFGISDPSLLGSEVPLRGMAGDQQAALFGQAGFVAGMTKMTFGTGCFAIANTGDSALTSKHRMLTTIASRINGKVTYALEGSVFVAGSAIQWLRDELGLIQSAAETEAIAQQCGVVDDVYVVPAFAGLGAPYWDPDARAAILGLSRGSDREQIVTATLQAIAYQARDLIDAMADDGMSPGVIRVDGGMVSNSWFLQFLSDMLNLPVQRPRNIESTVFGAACLAGLQCGIIHSLDEIDAHWQLDREFTPSMTADRSDRLLAGWRSAVARVRRLASDQ